MAQALHRDGARAEQPLHLRLRLQLLLSPRLAQRRAQGRLVRRAEQRERLGVLLLERGEQLCA